MSRSITITRAMATSIAIGLAALVAASAMPSPAWSQAEPMSESFTAAQREAVRRAAELAPSDGLASCGGVEREHVSLERSGTEGVMPDAPTPGWADDDACHYARGTTLIMHVFINHAAGSWTLAERQEQAAKAADAKQYFLDHAPANAYMHFDNEGTTGYAYYMPTLPYALPLDQELDNNAINDAVELLGFTDDDGDGAVTDEMSLWLQGWSGGWDNVILMFQPAGVEVGVARASFDRAWCKVYRNIHDYTIAHEWGHVFGACDEYSSGLTDCNGIYCDDVCQSWYLNDAVPNGNCESDPCGAVMNCLMQSPVWMGDPCPYTPRNWGWIDDDGDGLLDATKRNQFGTLYNLYELFHNGYFIHTNTDWGMVANERWNSWSAIGVRSRGTSDYDLFVYGENNRNELLASSGLTGQEVDFVVGDFNHNRLGEDHIRVRKDAGSGQYVLAYESGTGMLFADGVDRSQTWADYNVVRSYDVPLFAGETITFSLHIDTPGLDMGMALYKSNGGTYYTGRTGSQWEEDDWPAGISESRTFEVPADDVYGLVVWSNTEIAGNWSIQIGPTPSVLAEETPHTSFLDLKLYSYVPNVSYWAVAGTRPGAATNATLRLFQESTYETELATSGAYPTVEFIAADYNPGYSTDYLRLIRESGVNPFITEWEQSADVANGFESGTWTAGHVCKVWDTYLLGGQTYQFRQYNNGSALDGGIYVMSSADGDRYIQRSGAAAGSNSHPPAQDGEWFTYTPPADDWYGFVLIANDESSGNYSIGVGPRVSLAENVPVSYPDELVWTDFATQNGSWAVAGVRADPGVTARAGVWSCNSYGVECYRAVDAPAPGVSYVVLDGNHLAAGPYYPRFDRMAGLGDMIMSCDVSGASEIAFDGDPDLVTVNGSFAAGEVVRIWDFNLTAAPMQVQIAVRPLAAGLDVGVGFFSSAGGDYDQGSVQAIESANAAGPGVAEIITVNLASADVYGLVVTNENGAAGNYRIQVLDGGSSLASVSEVAPARLSFRASTGNPSREGAKFELLLPQEAHVNLDIYDVSGRLVRTVAHEALNAGTHVLAWDGRDETGRGVSAGLYMARLNAGDETRTVKLIQAE